MKDVKNMGDIVRDYHFLIQFSYKPMRELSWTNRREREY